MTYNIYLVYPHVIKALSNGNKDFIHFIRKSTFVAYPRYSFMNKIVYTCSRCRQIFHPNAIYDLSTLSKVPNSVEIKILKIFLDPNFVLTPHLI